MRLVRAVYFDTSILRSMPYCGVAKAINAFREELFLPDVPLFAPEICVRELAGYHTLKAQKELGKARDALRAVTNYVPAGSECESQTPVIMAPEGIRQQIDDDLANAHVATLPIPTTEVSTLVDMAIARTPPFDERGRGFRDALILDTICAHAQSYAGHEVVLLAADGDFSAPILKLRGGQIGVVIKRASAIDETGLLINRSAVEAAWALKEVEQRRAVALVEAERETFLAKVRKEAELNYLFLRSYQDDERNGDRLLSAGSPLDDAYVHAVKSIEFHEIVPGPSIVIMLRSKELDPDRKYFGLAVVADIEVLIERTTYPLTRYSLPIDDMPGQRYVGEPRRATSTTTVRRQIPFVVSVTEHKGQFEDARFEWCDA